MASASQVPSRSAQPGGLDMLLEMDLPVCVSFGSAEVPLLDLLKLTIGSNIELDRPTGDPVDIVVNDRVIAQGEVVVVDGNYGVRIQRIASPNDRLQSPEPSLAAEPLEDDPEAASTESET